MATINLRDNRQVIDYLARDYDSFRQALLNLIPAKLPEWTDRSEADFGVVLIELFAYMADILSYYQDRLANEAFLTTAQERRSVINHLRLIGYEMAPAAPAAARLSLIVAQTFNGQLEVRKGDQFATVSSKERKSVTFEYTGEKPLIIDCSAANPTIIAPTTKPDGAPLPTFKEIPAVIAVREGRSISSEVLGVSNGAPNQRFTLAQPRVLPDTLEIRVESVPPQIWRRRKNLIFSGRAFSPAQLAALEMQERIGATLAFSRSGEQDYMTETDENDYTTVMFGDGQYGQIPPTGVRLLANYRAGGGTLGNAGAGQITAIAKAPQLQLAGAKVVNRTAASGGAERESIEKAIRFAPTVFSSMQRAVTANDYVALAKLFPGVAKARAVAANWNNIDLYIAPTGSGQAPSDILQQELKAYFEDKRMLTSQIIIKSPDYVPIDITAEVTALSVYSNDVVKEQVRQALRQLLAFEQVDFKQTLHLSKIYEAVESLESVANVYVPQFEQRPAQQRNPPPVPTPAGQNELIASNGRIELGENEIPVLAADSLVVKVTGGSQ